MRSIYIGTRLLRFTQHHNMGTGPRLGACRAVLALLLVGYGITPTRCFDIAHVFLSNVEYTMCNDLQGHVYGRYSLVSIADTQGSTLQSVSMDPFRYIPVSVETAEYGDADHRIGSNATFSSASIVVRTACVDYGGDAMFFANALKTPNTLELEATYGDADGGTALFQASLYASLEVSHVIDYRFFSSIDIAGHLQYLNATSEDADVITIYGNERVQWGTPICVTQHVGEEYAETVRADIVSVIACESVGNDLSPEIWAPTSTDTSFFCDKLAWDRYVSENPGASSPVKSSFHILTDSGHTIRPVDDEDEPLVARVVPGGGDAAVCFQLDDGGKSSGERVIHIHSTVRVSMVNEHGAFGRSLLLKPMKRGGEDEFRTRHLVMSVIMAPGPQSARNDAEDGEFDSSVHLEEALLLLGFVIAATASVWALCSSYNRKPREISRSR